MKNRVFNIIKKAFFIFALFFISRYVYSNWDQIINYDWDISIPYLILSLVIITFAVFFSALRLKKVFGLENINLPLPSYLHILGITNLYLYIPGGIWNHIGIALHVKERAKKNKSLKKIGKLELINIGVIALSAAFYLVFLIPSHYAALFMIFYFIIICFIPRIFRLLNILFNIFKLKAKLPQVNARNFSIIIFINAVFWFLNGLSFVVFLRSLGVLPIGNIQIVIKHISSYVVSWLAGFLVIFAPGGLGIREAVLSKFLQASAITAVLGVTVSMLFRLLILTRDLFLFGFLTLLVKLNYKCRKTKTN